MKSSKLKLGNSKYKEKRPIERNKDKDKNEWNSSYFLKFRIMKKKKSYAFRKHKKRFESHLPPFGTTILNQNELQIIYGD